MTVYDESDWAADVNYNWERTDPSWYPTLLTERLWIGGTPETDVVVHPGHISTPWQPTVHRGLVDACLTMTPIAGPAGDGVFELRIPLRDRDGEDLNLDILGDAVDWALSHHLAGRRVLVRCHGGLNRSGLVAVPLMTWLNPELTFEQALEHARLKRHPRVLSRAEFETAARQLARPGA